MLFRQRLFKCSFTPLLFNNKVCFSNQITETFLLPICKELPKPTTRTRKFMVSVCPSKGLKVGMFVVFTTEITPLNSTKLNQYFLWSMTRTRSFFQYLECSIDC